MGIDCEHTSETMEDTCEECIDEHVEMVAAEAKTAGILEERARIVAIVESQRGYVGKRTPFLDNVLNGILMDIGEERVKEDDDG